MITLNKLVVAFRELNKIHNWWACLQISNDDKQKIDINYWSNVASDWYISLWNANQYCNINAQQRAEEAYSVLSENGRNIG